MSLNPSKGNMYDWITHTWNTVKGECPHGCSYCYMHRWGKQNPVRFDVRELKTDLGSDNFIFVGSSCDMFADDIPEDWVRATLLHCGTYFKNKYLFQTKNPKRLLDYILPNAVVCTTIESDLYYSDIMQRSPHPHVRAKYMELLSVAGFETYVTIEPIMDFNLWIMVDLIRKCNPSQVNIGADTGRNNLPEPTASQIIQLIAELEKFTVVKQKSNLKRLLK